MYITTWILGATIPCTFPHALGSCVCVHVCVCRVCTSGWNREGNLIIVFVCICVLICAHGYMGICVGVYMCVCVYVCMCVDTCICAHVYMCICVYVYMCRCVDV